MIASAPAKVILTGEHSVVYGTTALALAVRRYARCNLEPSANSGVEINLPDLGVLCRADSASLLAHHQQCAARYAQFLAGSLPIEQVLPEPDSLIRYALAELLQQTSSSCSLALHGSIGSEIPLGAGMGSSAATIAALLMAVAHCLQLPLSRDQLVSVTQSCERLQHGRSSGIDPAVCCHGGLVCYRQGSIERQSVALGPGWYLVDSGRPEVSTGTCVEQVREQFATSAIWQEFEAVAQRMLAGLKAGDLDGLAAAVRQNHRLLCDIGVVPAPVQDFITAIEHSGGSGKVSGAGAVAGAQAGLLMIYHPCLPESLVSDYGYNLLPLEIDHDGARIDN